MASGPIISFQIDRKKVKRVTQLVLGDSKTTAESDCSHEIKRHLFLERKAMTNLGGDSKAEISFYQKSQSYGFSICDVQM